MRNSALGQRAVGGDGVTEAPGGGVRPLLGQDASRPDDEREGAVAVLLDAGLAVGLVLAAFLEQRRDVFGAKVDFDKPGMDEVAAPCGARLGVQVGLER